MLPRALIKNYDQRRLRILLAGLFLALAIPTGVLVWQGYSQLKWESFYQYRVQAEELTNRIDSTITTAINTAESRNFSDFSFLNSVPTAKIQQRSPLADWPVAETLPGLIGYFQVEADGAFSTPLLPAAGIVPADVDIDDAEFRLREIVASEIQTVLARNKLVRDRVSLGARVATPIEGTPALEETRALPASQPPASVGASATSPGKEGADPAEDLRARDELAVTSTMASFENETTESVAEPKMAEVDTVYSQQVFDLLNEPARRMRPASADQAFEDSEEDRPGEKARANNALGRVEDIKFDDELQKKSEGLKRQVAAPEAETKDLAEQVSREARFSASRTAEPSALIPPRQDLVSSGLTITAFESDIDPFEFSLLDSGHLVLFRNAWHNGNRTIQGLLVDQNRFVSTAIVSAFRSTTLSDMSNLVVGYNDDVITMLPGSGSYPGDSLTSAAELAGALLYRSRLSAPFDGLELIFTANRLPPGPGATVLGWTTVVIAVVFLGGFLALYRLGMSQIRLAQQQQDFVSAVSHELKTPLTSIRMYGEMLKEGWADETKRKQYYEYIHDESERLTRLISNVLQLAKISRNEPQFNLKTTTVNALMDQVHSKIASQVERAGFVFNLLQEGISPDTRVSIDDDCFAQIIINLVDNAIKFSKNSENKTIEVGCKLTRDNQVVFSVRDHGPGIPKDQMKKIFKLFYRTESELTRETVGTGIGLAIVHQLTTAMNGKVDVANRDPGAQFNVSFPVL